MQTVLFTDCIHHLPPALRLINQLTVVNQVIKSIKALPQRLHIINWKITETTLDFLLVLSLGLRENQTDQLKQKESQVINESNQRTVSLAPSVHVKVESNVINYH